MSLNSLPDEIIAKIAKRMPGQDRCNLMATSKRYGNIWKAYKLDYKFGIVEKIRIEHHYFGLPSDVDIQLIRDQGASLKGTIKTYQQFGRILGEIRQIGILELERVEVTTDFVKELQKRKCKLQEIRFTNLTVFNLSKADFLVLTSFGQKLFFDNVRCLSCRSYATVEFRDNKPICVSINPEPKIIEDRLTEAEFFSNEILQAILPQISEMIVAYYEPFTVYSDGRKLTNRFLEEDLPMYWPKVFKLGSCSTGFTLDGILNFIQLSHSEGQNDVSYQLGLCNVACKDEAKKRAMEFAAGLGYQIVITDEEADQAEDPEEEDIEEEIEEDEYGPYFYIQLTAPNQTETTFSFTI